MKPAPPVTSTRVTPSSARARHVRDADGWTAEPPSLTTALTSGASVQFLRHCVQRHPLHVALDPAEIFADQGEDESFHAQDEDDPGAGEERPGEVPVGRPVDDPVRAERDGGEGADETDGDADPLHGLRPEAGDDVQ